MVRLLIASALVGVSAAALAASGDEKKCILAAAEKLPGVPGLTITASRAEAGAKPGYLVTIDFEAAKQTYSATFDCLINGPGAVAKMRGLPE